MARREGGRERERGGDLGSMARREVGGRVRERGGDMR